MGHPIYHIEILCERCEVRVALNDVPVGRLRSVDEPEWVAPPINPYLVGSENMLEVSVYPATPPHEVGADEAPIDLSQARIEVVVRRFEKGEPVVPGTGQPVLEVAVHDELAVRIQEARDDEEELEIPQTFFHLFDNEAVSAAPELRDADPFDDEEALRDYAIRLRDIAAARDAAALVAEMEPKIQAYMAAYDEPHQPFYDSLLAGMRDELLAQGVRTDFERGDVLLEPCSGGRLWTLRRPDGGPLLQTEPDPEGNTMQMEVVVAPREGALKVVR